MRHSILTAFLSRSSYLLGFFLLAFCLMLASMPAHARYAAYIYDVKNDRVLYSLNEDTRNYPASLTKMMTLYMVFHALERGQLSLNDPIKISRQAAAQPPSKLGLKAGETISVENAILALVTKSANDIATAIGEHIGGSEAKFARMMTKKARAIGMSRTSFRNASGLPNRGQLSTARDMGHLGIRLQTDFPQYYHYFKRQSFTYRGKKYKNHNKLLSDYQGTDGIKTGYTRASGFNLVANVKRDNHHVIGVVFGGKTGQIRNKHLMSLLNKGFAKLEQEQGVSFASNQSGPISLPSPPIPNIDSNTNPYNLAQGDASGAEDMNIIITDVALDHLENYGDWVVQVGAFRTKQQAAKAALVAKSSLASSFQFNRGRGAISQDQSDRLYRSMLIGYSKREAQNICTLLQRKSIDCFTKNVKN